MAEVSAVPRCKIVPVHFHHVQRPVGFRFFQLIQCICKGFNGFRVRDDIFAGIPFLAFVPAVNFQGRRNSLNGQRAIAVDALRTDQKRHRADDEQNA